MPGHIDPLTAALLGVVQGATEFLPVSSDGHVALFALLFGETEMPLSMVILLHFGTLIATLLVFRADVRTLLQATWRAARRPRELRDTEDGRLVAAILVASVPTAIIGLAMRDAVVAWARVPAIVGVCLLGSALAVASTRWSGARASLTEAGVPLPHAALIGVAQGLAVLPGLSRSACTIACAMALGTVGPAAFRLSFLMSLPAVAGAVLLELRHPEVLRELGPSAMVGAGVAFVVGWGCLLALRGIVRSGRFWAFAIYLVPLGATLLAWDLVGPR